MRKAKKPSSNQDNVSEIVPIAQSNMVKTFIYGLMPGALREIENLFKEAVSSLQANLVSSDRLQPKDDIEAFKEEAKVLFSMGFRFRQALLIHMGTSITGTAT